MPRSESFGAFVFLRDKLRLAFAVISVPLRRELVLCAVCRVPCAAADGFRWVLRAVFILFAGVGVHLRPRAIRCSAMWCTKKSFCWALAVLEVHLQGIMLTFECHNERNCVCEIKQFGSV